MAKTLGFKKDKPEIVTFKRLNVQSYEEEFLNFWKSLGFRKEQNKNSKSYASSIKSLRKVLGSEYSWCNHVTIEKLKSYCEVFKSYTEENIAHTSPEMEKFEGKKLYFHQFVMSYSGFSYLRSTMEGTIGHRQSFSVKSVPDEVWNLSLEIEKLLIKKFSRGSFSSGERKSAVKFAQNIENFFSENANKIAFGVDKLTVIKGSYSVIDDFRIAKGIVPSVFLYTGNFASGAALMQAMDKYSYWKIYDKHEDDKTCVSKDPEKVQKILEERKRKEEEDLPDIVKRRREEMRKNGITPKEKSSEEDCSRRDEYLRKKQERRNPFGRR